MNSFFTLLRKDLSLELRTKETLTLFLGLAILFSLVMTFGLKAAFLPSSELSKMFPGVIWATFIFTATVSIHRSYEYELEHRTLEGLILTGTAPWIIYLAKATSNFVLMTLGQIFTVVVAAIFLDFHSPSVPWEFLLVLTMIVAAYSALATLLVALTATARLKAMLLPLILLPLLFPLLFAAIELSFSSLIAESFSFESPWFSLLLALDIIYILLGINLFEYLITD